MNQNYPKHITKEILKLYPKGYSSIDIKNIILDKYNFSLSSAGVRKKLHKYIIKVRNNKEAIILCHRNKQPIKQILKAYKKGTPIRELSRNFNITRETIRKILKENHLQIKNSRTALIDRGYIKEKEKFNLPSREKAYIFGLVMGDLTPVKKSNYTLKLITHTTHIYFAELMHQTFKKYGPTNYKINKRNEFRFNTYLDLESFSFLLESKKDIIPNWIDKNNFLHFLAGFIDSDGSVMIKKSGNRFQYTIRFFGNNLKILKEIKRRLEILNYHISMHKNHSKGDLSYHKGIKFQYNKDYYAIETYKNIQTLKLVKEVPIRHPEKLAKKYMMAAIEKRNLKYWKEIEEKVKKLKENIKKSVKLKKKVNLKINL